MNVIRACIVAAAIVGLASCQTTEAPEDPKPDVSKKVDTSLLLAARGSEARRDYTTALTYYRSLYEREPSNVAALVGMSRSLRQMGRAREAKAVVARALHADDRNAHLLAELGKAQLALGDGAEAVESLSRADAIAPNNWSLQSAIGIGYDRIGMYDLAARHYTKALELAPDNVTVLNNFALSKAQSNQLTDAIALLEQAAALPEAGPQVRQNLALLYAMNGDLDAAEGLVLRDLNDTEATQNMAYYRRLSQSLQRSNDVSSTPEADVASAPAPEKLARAQTPPTAGEPAKQPVASKVASVPAPTPRPARADAAPEPAKTAAAPAALPALGAAPVKVVDATPIEAARDSALPKALEAKADPVAVESGPSQAKAPAVTEATEVAPVTVAAATTAVDGATKEDEADVAAPESDRSTQTPEPKAAPQRASDMADAKPAAVPATTMAASGPTSDADSPAPSPVVVDETDDAMMKSTMAQTAAADASVAAEGDEKAVSMPVRHVEKLDAPAARQPKEMPAADVTASEGESRKPAAMPSDAVASADAGREEVPAPRNMAMAATADAAPAMAVDRPAPTADTVATQGQVEDDAKKAPETAAAAETVAVADDSTARPETPEETATGPIGSRSEIAAGQLKPALLPSALATAEVAAPAGMVGGAAVGGAVESIDVAMGADRERLAAATTEVSVSMTPRRSQAGVQDVMDKPSIDVVAENASDGLVGDKAPDAPAMPDTPSTNVGEVAQAQSSPDGAADATLASGMPATQGETKQTAPPKMMADAEDAAATPRASADPGTEEAPDVVASYAKRHDADMPAAALGDIAPAAGPTVGAPTDSADMPSPPSPTVAVDASVDDAKASVAPSAPIKVASRDEDGRRYKLQLGSFRDPTAADRGRSMLRERHPDLLSEITLEVVKATVKDRGDYYRVVTEILTSKNRAKTLCTALEDRRVGCLLVRTQ